MTKMKIYKYITIALILVFSGLCAYECVHSTSIDSYLFLAMTLCCAHIVGLDDLKKKKKKRGKSSRA